MSKERKEWFSEWFDSRYYHILYKNHDQNEADKFLGELSSYLNFKPEYKILDIPCGKGRHSIYLNKMGFDVTGVDLSPDSIKHAKQFSNERLKFGVHDMRDMLPEDQQYDVMLNLFTSFGYFDREEDNYQTLEVFSKALKPGGRLVIDFMNISKVLKTLVATDCNIIEDIEFCINRKIENGVIIKDITFQADGKNHTHQERIKIIQLDEFLKYFNLAKLSLIEIFGDYALNKFDLETSDRAIFILEKS